MPPCDITFVAGNVLIYRFNPCFSGCRPATLINQYRYVSGSVSILVLVDAALRRRRPPMCVYADQQFQSLF